MTHSDASSPKGRQSNGLSRRQVLVGSAAIATGTLTSGRSASAGSIASSGHQAAARHQDATAPIRVGMTGDGSTLDPVAWTNINERHFIPAIFDNLIDVDENLNLIPGLAASWTSSDDGLEWTLTLNDGILFHDGTPCDAEAVVFNFKRVLDESNGLRHRADISMVTAVEAVDRLSFKVTLGEPFAPFLGTLTESVGYISSPAAIEQFGDEYAFNPVGTGPFKFVEWRRDSELKLERNETYWRQGLPAASGVSFLPIPDTSVKLTNLRSDSIDIVDEIATADADAVASDPGLQLFTLAGSRWPMVRLNTIKAPFDNVLLRQAVTHAIPRDGIIQAIYFGRAQPAYGPISPLYTQVYDPNVSEIGLKYDIEAAKAKLAEAGVPDGFSFSVDIGSAPQTARTAELIQASLAEAGINMEIVPQESAAFTERLRSKEFEAALGSWTPRPDVDGTMYQHFHSKGLANWVSYSNPEVDALLDKTRTTPVGEERNDLFRQAERLIIQDAPWAFLVFEELALAARAEVTGFKLTPTTLLELKSTSVGSA